VSKFYKHTWPFRRNKTVMFGFVYIEKGLYWYKKTDTIPLLGPPGYYTASGAFMGFDSENSSREGELDLERAVAQPAPVRTT
jgi:hypothetical protein